MYISNHQSFFPLLLWEKNVTQVRSYKGTDPNTKCKVTTFMDTKGKRFAITYAGIWTKLQAAVQILCKGRLGFWPMEMGAHYLRFGADMAIYLVLLPPLIIMIIVIWWSDALFMYIRKQESQFPTKASYKMLQNNSLSQNLIEQSKKQKIDISRVC